MNRTSKKQTFPVVTFPIRIPDTIRTGEKFRGRPLVRLQVNFKIYIFTKKVFNGQLLEIPAGFEYDQGSIPRIFWPIILPNDPDFAAPWLLHDIAYAAELWPRPFNDKLMLAGSIYNKVKKFKRNLVYACVRAGGWYGYKKEHPPERIKKLRAMLGISNQKRPLWRPDEAYIPY